MKNLMTLVALLLFTVGSFAQTAVVKGNQAELKKSLSDGVVEFVMPEKTTDAEVKKAAQYYTEYFAVTFNQDTKVATIKLNDSEDQLARKIIQRFLLSTGVRTIKFDGNDYSIAQFYNEALK